MGGPGGLVLLILLTGCLDVSIPMGATGTTRPTCSPPLGATVSPSPGAALEDPGAAGPMCPPPWGAPASPSPRTAPGQRVPRRTIPGAAGALRVSQEPEQAWVAPGGGVALGCRVVVAEPWELLRLEWFKDGGDEALCVARLRPAGAEAPCAPRLHLAWRPPHATLHLRGARPGDAGCYVCRATLEIPRLATAAGNGTLLSTGAGLAGGLAEGLGVSALLLLGLALGYGWHRRRSADSVIYVNTVPHAA
ncbi:transmembrane and immunoglobulin domain-containing protein 2 isoform X2 [Rhea pennata]|uniref:transmembrane and immunoglobulin domain-containing protein 2 isoform X2 n=1 Tax=Rhea pennata TaxID=8795 RepID=UPI002E25F5A2